MSSWGSQPRAHRPGACGSPALPGAPATSPAEAPCSPGPGRVEGCAEAVGRWSGPGHQDLGSVSGSRGVFSSRQAGFPVRCFIRFRLRSNKHCFSRSEACRSCNSAPPLPDVVFGL